MSIVGQGALLNGEAQASDFNATGLQGSRAGARFVGGTPSGPPMSGTYRTGDFVIDQSGAMWICTVAGTPGIWVESAGGGAAAGR